MKFLVDPQLPRRVAGWLAAGCDAIHTPDRLDGNRTTDQQVIEAADREQRAVVTEDADFGDSHVLHARPARLLLISAGNISNRELEALMVPLLPALVLRFQEHCFLELGRAGLVVRGLAHRVPASRYVRGRCSVLRFAGLYRRAVFGGLVAHPIGVALTP